MAEFNWRTIDIDKLDPESSSNFDLTTLTPAVQPVSTQDVQTLSGQIKQLQRGGDNEGALRGALENAPYGADEQGKSIHLTTVTDILQNIRQSEMSPILKRMFEAEGGSELCDTLMKYLYKGMAQGAPSSGGAAGGRNITPQATGFSQVGGRNFGGAEGGGQAMSVLLSWHEKRLPSLRFTPPQLYSRLNSTSVNHADLAEIVAPHVRRRELEAKKGARTEAARKAVLDTTELLEAIIVCLPIKKIFAIQRVCRQVRTVISSSVQIQQKLFIRPCVPKEFWALRGHLGYEPGNDDGLQDAKDPEFELLRDVDAVSRCKDPISTPTNFCPLLKPLFHMDETVAMRLCCHDDVESFRCDLTDLFIKPGSWQTVQLTDRPCKRVSFRMRHSLRSHCELCQDQLHVTRPEGITLGDIVHAAMDTKQDFGNEGVMSVRENIDTHKCTSWGDAPARALTEEEQEEEDDVEFGLTVAEALQLQMEGDVVVESLSARVQLSDVVVPTEQGWSEVRTKRKSIEASTQPRD